MIKSLEVGGYASFPPFFFLTCFVPWEVYFEDCVMWVFLSLDFRLSLASGRQQLEITSREDKEFGIFLSLASSCWARLDCGWNLLPKTTAPVGHPLTFFSQFRPFVIIPSSPFPFKLGVVMTPHWYWFLGLHFSLVLLGLPTPL